MWLFKHIYNFSSLKTSRRMGMIERKCEVDESNLFSCFHRPNCLTCLEWRDDRVLLLWEWAGLFQVWEVFSRPLASDWLRLSEDPDRSISERRPQTPLLVVSEFCSDLPKSPWNQRKTKEMVVILRVQVPTSL